MVKEGKKINFHTVAEAAGLSVAYLYKYDSIKQRIDQLRKQQSPIKGLAQKQGASEDSKTAIITTFKERIKKQEVEIRGLRDHIEVAQGIAMQVPDLKQQIESLKSENLKLREQLNECLRQAEIQLAYTSSTDSKVISLDKKKTNQSRDISDKVKLELTELGIKLNTTLTKTIKSASVEIVSSAITALQEALDGGKVVNPGGWLNTAIRDGWLPSEKNLPSQKAERNTFNEWYELAYKQRLVLAATKSDDGQMYVYTPDGVPLPFEQMLAKYPLEKLKS